jgi:hypothetical protein
MAVSKLPTGAKRFIEERFISDQIKGTIPQTQQTVALIGDSLLIDSIEAALNAKPNLSVMRLASFGDGFEQRLPSSPDLVIVDLQIVQLGPILAYLLGFPGIPVLGIETNSNQVIALSSRHYTAECSDDLTRIIKDIAPVPVDRTVRTGKSL